MILVNPPAPRTIITDTKEQITCLATNKDFNLVACAGRQGLSSLAHILCLLLFVCVCHCCMR